MKIGIIQFPGSNCERETMLAITRAGMEPVEFLWNETNNTLDSFQGYVIVGGFSYEDRSRAGIIAAFDPVLNALKAESEKGKPILGICNGAQILVESGLVPGLNNEALGLALTDNKRVRNGKILGTGYYNNWVYLKLAKDYQRNAFTRHLTPNSILHVPVAHAEGRFVIPPALLKEMMMQGLNVFQYCDEAGNLDIYFPTNPNGSVENIAAISNKAGNVLAIMPHPERTENGDPLFLSMRDYIAQNHFQKVLPLYYLPRFDHSYRAYQKPTDSSEYLVKLNITDNHAQSVENTLRHHGFAVKVKRYTHWELTGALLDLKAINKSNVLINHRKETIFNDKLNGHAYLVRSKENMVGQEAKQTLNDFFSIKNLEQIKHGIVWEFIPEDNSVDIDAVLNTFIIHNPYAHDCYQYQH